MTETGRVPILDLRAQYARIRAEIDEAVARVVASGAYIKGEDCRCFEEEFARYCGASEAVGVANGTDALVLALRALGVGPGDEVVTVADTFIATGEAILLNGARPVFVDVDPKTHTLDPSLLERAITSRTKAILPVHLYGHPADMTAILEIANRFGLSVVEDAAQAHGAEIQGKRVGGLGTAACFSFYPSKNLGCCGDGGMVVTSDAALAARVRQLADHGAGAHRYDNVVLGTNSRLDSLQAAILRVKLRHLDDWNAERAALARAYSERLEGVPGLVVPEQASWARSAWCLYTVRVAGRDALQRRLADDGIATAIHYPKPIHLQPAMAPAGGRPGDLPVSEMLSREVLSLPLFPELPLEAVDRIASVIRTVVSAAF
jgi:dTDP-4-amino-4,6-dideoxygalactose transaminase